MSDFSDSWLVLRAAADSRARADRLVGGLGPWPGERIDVVDLGCGSGANLRHLAPLLGARFGGSQHWLCIDRDPALLALLPGRVATRAAAAGYRIAGTEPEPEIVADDWSCRLATMRLDLAADAERIPLPHDGLVTASALLDLVSARWLDALLARCRDARCRLLLALTYDGRCVLDPPLADDSLVIDQVNRHQCTDKGFGPALGPDAAAYAADCCRQLGYRIEVAPSDWVLEPQDAALQLALIDDWLAAASAMAPEQAARLDAWARDRRRLVAARRSQMRIGHQDLRALP